MTTSRTPLADALADALRCATPAPADADRLEAVLTGVVDRARARWPALTVDPEAFVRFVAERLGRDGSLPDALAALATDNLYLACGCARGDPVALHLFDQTFVREVGAFVAGVDRDPAFADEVRQALRARLFTGTEPKIREYVGSGALGGWVRVAALRIALNLKRGAARSPAPGRGAVEDAMGGDLGPELAYLRARYRDAFGDALRGSFEALGDRERTLLRLYHVEALSLDAIAALYRVHLSTVSRWLSRAREQVAEGTTRRLCERLGVGASAARSIAALVLSQVELSLTRLLGRGV